MRLRGACRLLPCPVRPIGKLSSGQERSDRRYSGLVTSPGPPVKSTVASEVITKSDGTGWPAPRLTHLGSAAVWWIPRPASPRLSVGAALLWWLLGAAATGGTLLWALAESEPLWPFNRQASGTAILLRYEYTLLVFLVYLTSRSIPAWLRCRRLARGDAEAIEAALASGEWEIAALRLHRFCLLLSSVWRRVPRHVGSWDALLRPHLTYHRRLYVYYSRTPPARPQDEEAGFVPVILKPPHPPLWSLAVLLPVAVALYLLGLDILRRGYWERVLFFNTVLLTGILAGYLAYFGMTLLGRSQYLRFAPGAVQFLKVTPLRRRPQIESYDLRSHHAVLDLTGIWPGLILLDEKGRWHVRLRLPRIPDAVEAALRACLSTAPTPPLPEDSLLG